MKRWLVTPYVQLFCLIVFGACSSEFEAARSTTGRLALSVQENYAQQEASRRLQVPVQGVKHMEIGIVDLTTGLQWADRRQFTVLSVGDDLLIEEIELPPGTYEINTFYLTDSSGTILYATPNEGSEFGGYLNRPLPIPFSVDENKIEVLNLEIVSTAAQNPGSFGFEAGLRGFKETFYFFVSVIRKKVGEYVNYLPAQLEVYQGSQLAEQKISGKINKVVLPKHAGEYHLVVTNPPFLPTEKTIGLDSLLLFQDRPLHLEMIKRVDDGVYVGGQFSGNIQLSTQAQLDSFGRKGYDVISGSLIIGQSASESDDPITDLSPLKTIETITANLEIRSNPKLTSLSGLQWLHRVNQLVIQDNPVFEGYEGLTGLQSLSDLLLVNNPVMGNFGGLEHVYGTLSRVHIEHMDGFLGILDLEAATNLWAITITSNPHITKLMVPPLWRDRISLNITNNPSLVSFGEGEGISGTIRSLTLEKNEKLESLEGLVSSEGKGLQGLSLSDMPKITTLSPLVFNEVLERRLDISRNESLEDIRALATISRIANNVNISFNPKLKSLEGFHPNMRYQSTNTSNIEYPISVYISSNPMLADFCALGYVSFVLPEDFLVVYNAYNPSLTDLRNDKCKP